MQEKDHRKLSKIVIISLGILIPSFIFFGLWNGPVFAATSDTVNLQGKIVRNDAGYEGLNVTDSYPACVAAGSGNDTCDFRIRYYDASSGGNLLLTEEFSNIEIGQYVGVFNLALGSDLSPTSGVYSSFSGLVGGEDDVYVEVGFDPAGSNTYTEVFTRMPLQATAYAIRAKQADTATGATEVPWSGLQDPTEDLSLEHSTQTTLFNWATGTGTDDLFSLTSDTSATGTGALMNVQTGAGSALVPFRVRSGSTEAIYVNSSGNVGIGATTLTYKLEVDGDTNLSTGGAFRIGGNSVLSADTLGSGVTGSSLTSVGTLVTGVWNATEIGEEYGGTGQTTYTKGDILYSSGADTLAKRAIGSENQVLTVDATGVPVWAAPGAASSVPFSGITSGTNTSAAMVVGVGASLVYNGGTVYDGGINANYLLGGTWASPGAIGSTTPNTGAFTTLTASTSLTTPLVVGTSTSLTLRPTTNAVNAVKIANAGGTEILSVDTTNSRVGIGVTSPSTQFHTTGGVRFAGITSSTETTAVMADTNGNLSTRALGSLAFGSSLAFLDLSDVTESTYTGSGGQLVAVNSGETGLEFVTSVPASSVPFSGITTGTNTSATMTVDTGASLTYANSGTINASSLQGSTWAVPAAIGSTTPNTGAFTTLTASTSLTTPLVVGTSTSLTLRPTTNAVNAVKIANAGGTEILSVDTTNSRVGIGTIAPSTQFHTTGGVRFAGITSSTETTAVMADTNGNLSTRALGSLAFDSSLAFLDLSDVTETTYTGSANYLVSVNSTADGLEFISSSTLGGYWQRTSPNISPTTENDNVLPNGTSANLGAAGARWDYIYGNIGSFDTLTGGTSTLTLQPASDGLDAVRIRDFGDTTTLFSADTTNMRIGIGTSSPDTDLHVAGQVKITGGSPGSNKVLTSDTVGLASWTDLGTLGGLVTSITGTVNQITASASTGDVTLSIPTDFRAPGTVNAVTAINTGAGAGTQRIDASGNLSNIGTITFTGSDVQLSRTLANVLSLASGDSFNLVSGSLQVGGTQVITSGRLIRAANGSATTPAFSFSADDNTGMYSGGTDILKLATAGADRVTILANGYVGIGETNPGTILEVVPDTDAYSILGRAFIGYDGTHTDEAVFGHVDMRTGTNYALRQNASGGTRLNAPTGQVIEFLINNSQIGTVSSSGLSLGSSGQFQVDTSGDLTKINNLSYNWPSSHTTDGFLQDDGSGGLSWAEINAVESTGTPYGSATEGPLAFWTSDSTISAPTPYGLYWDDTNQYLGIGTNNPSAPLDIAGGTGGSLIKNSAGDITIEPAEDLIISQGDVGIGTTNPLAKLHVKGNQILLKNEADADVGFVMDSGSTTTYRDVITFRDRGTDVFALEKTATNAFQLYDYAGTGVSRMLFEAGTNSGISMRTTGTGDFSFINDTTTMVTITDSGDVGVGYTSPSGKLDVDGRTWTDDLYVSNSRVLNAYGVPEVSSGIDGRINFGANTNDKAQIYSEVNGAATGLVLYIADDTSDYIDFANNNGSLMRILYGGSVGIGTTSPDSLLEVSGTRSNTIAVNTSIAAIGGADVAIRFGTLLGTPNWGTWMQSTSDAGSVQPLSINPLGGNVGIGTASPNSKLEVAGTIHSTTGGFKFPDNTVQTTAAAFNGARVRKSANQWATNTYVTWNIEDYDTNGYHDNSTNNTRLTIPVSGYYSFGALVGNDNGTGGNGGHWSIVVNRTEAISAERIQADGGNVWRNLSGQRYFNAGDYIEVYFGHVYTRNILYAGGLAYSSSPAAVANFWIARL